MFPGLHVSVENTANAESTFFFLLLFYRDKSVQPIFIFNTRAHPKKDSVTEEDARRRMIFVQNLLYLHGKRRGCDASSNWKLDARRVNENLSIHGR